MNSKQEVIKLTVHSMRILFISNYYPPVEIGGWEQLTRDVACLFQERGHQVSVLTSNYRADEIVEPETAIQRKLYLESPDHTRYHLSNSIMCRRREGQNGRLLKQTVLDFTPDIIFINGMWNLPVSVAQYAEYLCPGRVVYYMASDWPTELDAHTAHWQAPPTASWKRPLKNSAAWFVQRLLVPGSSRNQLAFDHVLCVSAFMQNHMVNEAKIPRPQTQVIHNGINPNIFTFRELKADSTPLRLLYAGQIVEHKGVHTAVESLGILLQSQASLPVTLSVVGSGPPEYSATLKQRVRDLGLSEHVHFPGRVPREKMPAILADHDVLLLPSLWAEPLARVTQEAMACGLVVIGTTTGGTPEILIDGENGLTFEAKNAQMLAAKINQLVQDSALQIKLAQAARQTIEEKFTMNRMVSEIESCFDRILTQSNDAA
ncbi:MAG: glycosyltransferase family 4 protein [Chloroflexi bacterium]|nr:glycosyltransferase family 4 protein [Chloroflexota bacterium]